MLTEFLLCLLAFLVTWGLTEAFRRRALARQWLDVPNERSSHVMPTPRGGGVVLATVFLLLAGLQGATSLSGLSFLIVLLSAAAVALCGAVDDRISLSPRARLSLQGLAAAGVLVAIGGLPALPVFGQVWGLGWAGHVLAWLFLLWLLNLFNFMDGIDGIAATQAISVLAGGALCHWIAGIQLDLATLALLLAAACAGFLCLNWPPARIFMGDSGSAFLGFVIAAFALLAAHGEPSLFWCWVLLMGVFVVDATWTLCRRLLRGEKVWQAHRSHAFQRASRRFGAHRPVTLAVLLINLFWLLPLALLVAAGRVDGAFATCLAYAPLVFVVLKFDAGKVE